MTREDIKNLKEFNRNYPNGKLFSYSQHLNYTMQPQPAFHIYLYFGHSETSATLVQLIDETALREIKKADIIINYTGDL